MLYKTEGIVLGSVKYRESSLVVTFFTSEFGLLSYIVNSVRTAKPRFHPSLFQPLTIVELVTYHSVNKHLQRFSEIKLLQSDKPFESATKTCIKLFLAEFLGKILKEEGKNIELFEFVKIKLLEFNDTLHFRDFHLYFLADFTNYLGININESEFFENIHIKKEEQEKLIAISNGMLIELNRIDRVRILSLLLEYINQFHQIGRLKSIEILSEVLD